MGNLVAVRLAVFFDQNLVLASVFLVLLYTNLAGNLILNTNSLTYSDLKNYNNSDSNQFASNLQLGNNPNNPETLRSSSRLRLETCSRQGRSVALLLCPFSLKSAVKADFLRSNPGNLTLTLNQQGREQSSDTKATIGLGVVTVGGKTMESFLTTSGHEATPNPGNQLSTNSNSYYSAINRDITQVETNKRDVLTSDFDSKITLDTRLISAAGNLAVASAKFSAATTASIFGNEQLEAELVASSLDSSRKASANVEDYWNQTTEGAKITYKFTPFGVNKNIEETRGSKQSFAWGDSAVYKSGDEPNGVRDERANNVGMANVADNEHPAGSEVKFSDLLKQGVGPSLGNEGGVVSVACNYAVIGCNDMSLTHDNLAGQLKRDYPEIPTVITNQGTIIPAYIYNTYGLIGMPINRAIDYFNEPKYVGNPTPIRLPEPTLISSFNSNNSTNSTSQGLNVPPITFPSQSNSSPSSFFNLEFNRKMKER